MNPWGYHTPTDYLEAARSSRSSDELTFLASAPYDFVRLAVARNPHVTPTILRDLVPQGFATWNQQELAGAIAVNPKTPHDALRAVALGLRQYLDFGRGTEMAGYAAVEICDTPHVPLEFIKLLIAPTETSPRIRKKIANNCSRRDVLALLLSDTSEAVRTRAQRALEKI